MALNSNTDEVMQEMREAKRLEPDELDFQARFDFWLRDPDHAGPAPSAAMDFRRAMIEAREKESRDILQSEPDFAQAHANLAGALAEEGRGEEALAEITEAVRLEPGVATLQVTMAAIAAASSHEELSVQAWREAVREAPSNLAMRDRLVRAPWDRNDFDGARAEFRECLRQDPEDFQCHIVLAGMLENLGDLDGTIAEGRRDLAVHPNDADNRLELARVLQNNGDLKGALAECEEVLREQSLENHNENESWDARIGERRHERLASVFMAEGLTTDAVGEFKAALVVEPNAIWLRFGFGEALDKTGASGQAQEEFRDVLRKKSQ